MMDYENAEYQKLVINYIDELVECGVSKVRLDQFKHYGLPNEFGEGTGTFVNNVMRKYGKDFWIGEVLFEDNKDLLNEFTKYAYVHSMNMLENNDRMLSSFESGRAA